MKDIKRHESFTCTSCSQFVPKSTKGIRNHCPFCLTSLHVDKDVPGDRQSTCHGVMTPTALHYNSQKGYQILFTCRTCGATHKNMIASDDNHALITNLMKLSNEQNLN